MIDYFALLDQPRGPWLDLDKLKDAYHRKTLREHSDVQPGDASEARTDAAMAKLNQAYQILRDPKQRLHHLLTLEGCAPSGQVIPAELRELFPSISETTNHAKALLDQMAKSSTALTRALFKPNLLELQDRTKEIRDRIQRLRNDSEDELQRINEAWKKSPAEQLPSLSNLYFTFAYLNRWLAQLDEMGLQLSML